MNLLSFHEIILHKIFNKFDESSLRNLALSSKTALRKVLHYKQTDIPKMMEKIALELIVPPEFKPEEISSLLYTCEIKHLTNLKAIQYKHHYFIKEIAKKLFSQGFEICDFESPSVFITHTLISIQQELHFQYNVKRGIYHQNDLYKKWLIEKDRYLEMRKEYQQSLQTEHLDKAFEILLVLNSDDEDLNIEELCTKLFNISKVEKVLSYLIVYGYNEKILWNDKPAQSNFIVKIVQYLVNSSKLDEAFNLIHNPKLKLKDSTLQLCYFLLIPKLMGSDVGKTFQLIINLDNWSLKKSYLKELALACFKSHQTTLINLIMDELGLNLDKLDIIQLFCKEASNTPNLFHASPKLVSKFTDYILEQKDASTKQQFLFMLLDLTSKYNTEDRYTANCTILINAIKENSKHLTDTIIYVKPKQEIQLEQPPLKKRKLVISDSEDEPVKIQKQGTNAQDGQKSDGMDFEYSRNELNSILNAHGMDEGLNQQSKEQQNQEIYSYLLKSKEYRQITDKLTHLHNVQEKANILNFLKVQLNALTLKDSSAEYEVFKFQLDEMGLNLKTNASLSISNKETVVLSDQNIVDIIETYLKTLLSTQDKIQKKFETLVSYFAKIPQATFDNFMYQIHSEFLTKKYFLEAKYCGIYIQEIHLKKMAYVNCMLSQLSKNSVEQIMRLFAFETEEIKSHLHEKLFEYLFMNQRYEEIINNFHIVKDGDLRKKLLDSMRKITDYFTSPTNELAIFKAKLEDLR